MQRNGDPVSFGIGDFMETELYYYVLGQDSYDDILGLLALTLSDM